MAASSRTFEQNAKAGHATYQFSLDRGDNTKTPIRVRTTSIDLHAEDLASVRFVFSPLWESVCAFRTWLNQSSSGLFAPWISRIGAAVCGTDWKLLADVVGRCATIPVFLCPSATTAFPTLRDELEDLLRLPDELIRAEIKIAFPSFLPSSLSDALKKPSDVMSDLADLLETFWTRAIARDWTLLRAKLESELLYRARAFAVSGLTGLFDGLHKGVSFQENRLTVHNVSSWDGKVRKSGLLLVPSVFSWPDVFFTMRPPSPPTIIYPCRGLADQWDAPAHNAPNGLDRLIGCTCAQIMHILESPQTTLETAAAVELCQAAASEQITKLWRAGILERTRIGRRVFYRLNEKGIALLKIFSP